jgi:hypothetical protein
MEERGRGRERIIRRKRKMEVGERTRWLRAMGAIEKPRDNNLARSIKRMIHLSG